MQRCMPGSNPNRRLLRPLCIPQIAENLKVVVMSFGLRIKNLLLSSRPKQRKDFLCMKSYIYHFHSFPGSYIHRIDLRLLSLFYLYGDFRLWRHAKLRRSSGSTYYFVGLFYHFWQVFQCVWVFFKENYDHVLQRLKVTEEVRATFGRITWTLEVLESTTITRHVIKVVVHHVRL